MSSIDGCAAPDASTDELTEGKIRWSEILPKTKLKADAQQLFEKELNSIEHCTHIRLNIYPDGGVSRLRVWGTTAKNVEARMTKDEGISKHQ